MAQHILGPLYYEQMGRRGPVIAFVHPNPLDHSSWLYQLAHLSTWYRCIAIDLPGYGRSPKATDGLTMQELAGACWQAIDDVAPGATAILAGCSIGSTIAPHMQNIRPDRSSALILTGTGYVPGREFVPQRIAAFRSRGIEYRRDYTLEDFSAAFRTTELGACFADIFAERNDSADVDTIVRLFEAYLAPDPEGHFQRIACPTLILTGSEDVAHKSAFELQARIPGCELQVLPNAGHACQMEQPWLFDRLMVEFLDRHGLHPSPRRLAASS